MDEVGDPVGPRSSAFRPAHVVAEDTRLAEGVQQGLETALRELTARFAGPIAGLIASEARSSTHDDVVRATIETLVQAWRNADQFEPGRDLEPWLQSLAAGVMGWPRSATQRSAASGQGRGHLAWLFRRLADRLSPTDRSALAEAAGRLEAPAGGSGVSPIADRLIGQAQALEADLDIAEARAVLADAAMWVELPGDLADRVLTAIESEAIGAIPPPPTPARRRSWLRPAIIAVAATLVALFGGLVLLAALNDATPQRVLDIELVPTGELDAVGGSARVAALDTGVRVDLDAAGLPSREGGAHYAAWFELDDGSLLPLGTFQSGLDVALSGGVELERVVEFTITIESAEPDGDGQASSGDVVLKFSFDDT